ncbi:50S ribosomal protein L28 [bacterium]|nr:MAG: 50S ribosomal protein L28 [bacterium]
MFKKCAICGKNEVSGSIIVRKGLAKKKGGTGKKISRVSKRTFFANLQKIRIIIDNHPKKAYVCTKCIKKGRVQKA